MRSVVECGGFSIARNRPGRANEDYSLCFTNTTDATGWADFAAVVADGVGSSGNPRDAAVTTVECWLAHMKAKFLENSSSCATFEDLHFSEMTAHAFLQAHEAVLRETDGSACAVAACLQGQRLIVGNVGDCRVYRISGSTIEQLSEDQVDAAGHPTSVIGGKHIPAANANSGAKVMAGDVIVLCSDGVWKLLGANEILRAAASGNAREIAARLENAVSSRRGQDSDDATAVVAVIKRVGRPFWDTTSQSEDEQLKDEYVDAKVNEVLAELLNRLRTSAEKHSEQSVNKLNAAIQDLRADMEAMVAESRHAGRGRRSSSGLRSSFVSAALAVLLLVGGVLVGQNLNVADKKPQKLKLALPSGSHVVSQQYNNDRLLVKYLDNSGKQKLGIYRLADGGQPFAIIDLPGENRANVSVP